MAFILLSDAYNKNITLNTDQITQVKWSMKGMEQGFSADVYVVGGQSYTSLKDEAADKLWNALHPNEEKPREEKPNKKKLNKKNSPRYHQVFEDSVIPSVSDFEPYV